MAVGTLWISYLDAPRKQGASKLQARGARSRRADDAIVDIPFPVKMAIYNILALLKASLGFHSKAKPPPIAHLSCRGLQIAAGWSSKCPLGKCVQGGGAVTSRSGPQWTPPVGLARDGGSHVVAHRQGEGGLQHKQDAGSRSQRRSHKSD